MFALCIYTQESLGNSRRQDHIVSYNFLNFLGCICITLHYFIHKVSILHCLLCFVKHCMQSELSIVVLICLTLFSTCLILLCHIDWMLYIVYIRIILVGDWHLFQVKVYDLFFHCTYFKYLFFFSYYYSNRAYQNYVQVLSDIVDPVAIYFHWTGQNQLLCSDLRVLV